MIENLNAQIDLLMLLPETVMRDVKIKALLARIEAHRKFQNNGRIYGTL